MSVTYAYHLTFASSKRFRVGFIMPNEHQWAFVTRGPDPDVSAIEILAFMTQHPDPGFTAAEVAEEFDKTRQWADNRLKKMAEAGLLHSKNPGGRSRFYWPSQQGKEQLRKNRGN